MNITDHIERIAQKAEDSKLKAITKNMMPDIKPVMDFLGCTKEQALIFALIFYHTLESGDADLSDLARHFQIPVMRMLKYKKDLDHLTKNRLIRQQENRGPFRKTNSVAYYVHSKVIDGILRKKLKFNAVKISNNFDFIIRVVEEIESSAEDVGGFDNLEADFLELCRENKNLFTANKLLNSKDFPVYEKLILVLIAFKLMEGEEEVTVSDACSFLEGNKSFQLKVRRSFINGCSKLFVRGLIESRPGMFRNENELTITDKGLEYLLGDESEQFALRSNRVKNEIQPAKISSVKLFLNTSEAKQLKTLEELFDLKKFEEVSSRMKKKKMKAGIPVLLYGSPGTGKTESVYQLARKTGRSIIPVEISKTKSMWFGESEKMIKDVFEKYKQISHNSKVCPILLFNEADGIFSKRTTKLDSPVSQTLNAMQNIILQEMEDFEGIMVATTNLTDNLDKAFDRRFLYKVKFEIPEKATRVKIMQNKLPFLTPLAVKTLCGQFSLTGGQMANIAKKCNIHELLNGKLPNPGEIENLCRDELGLQAKNKLGF